MEDFDKDLIYMDEEALMAEIRRLRKGIRKHRDSSGHDLCWYHPELWLLLPEGIMASPSVPSWCEFMQRCAEYRASLDKKG